MNLLKPSSNTPLAMFTEPSIHVTGKFLQPKCYDPLLLPNVMKSLGAALPAQGKPRPS